MSSVQQKPIDVAIVGGGIAGLTTAVGLQKYPHINVQIYESAHKFGEVGAGVVLGPNSQRAMTIIDPRIKEGYDRRAAFDDDPPDEDGLYPWMTVVKGQQPDLGQKVIQFKHKVKGSTIHRAHFLDELVKLIDMDRAHFGKRLDHIYETNDKSSPIVLHFKDGSTASADVVIGADGIHSDVRRHVLGPQDPGANAFFTGTVQYRATVPFEKAEEKLGKIEQSPGQLCGTNGSVFGFPLSNKTLYYIGVTVSNSGPWQHDKWIANVNLDEVKKQFSDWDDYSRKIVELLPTDGSTMAWSVWEMPPASTFFKDRIVITGDAAHASTPFQGAGAGQAIEDALVLEQLLGKYLDPAIKSHYLPTPQEAVPYLLQVYDTIRRFRSQKVVTTSRQTGRISTCSKPGVGNTAAEIRNALQGRQHWIWDHDQEQQVKDAFQLFGKTSVKVLGEVLTQHPQMRSETLASVRWHGLIEKYITLFQLATIDQYTYRTAVIQAMHDRDKVHDQCYSAAICIAERWLAMSHALGVPLPQMSQTLFVLML